MPIIGALRIDSRRISGQAVHIRGTIERRRPEVAARALIARGRAVVVARERGAESLRKIGVRKVLVS